MYIKMDNFKSKNSCLIVDFLKKNMNIYNQYSYMSQYWDVETINYINIGKIPNFKYEELEPMLYGRTIEQYFDNLVEGWLIEDFVRYKLSAIQSNLDSNRKFMVKQEDLRDNHGLDLLLDGQTIEVVSDYTGYVARRKTISLNHKKYNRILNNNAYLLIIDVKNNCFYLTDLKNSREIGIKKFNSYYKKEIKLEDLQKITHSMDNLNHTYIKHLINK